MDTIINKAQQDAFLPYVEKGSIILIGATTENPFFEVNSALISRSRIVELHSLSKENLAEIIARALVDDRGLKGLYSLDDEARDAILLLADGDARSALNTLSLSSDLAKAEGSNIITEDMVRRAVPHRMLPYDKNKDMHYDIISAFIKSMRGSDPDAALYWLARMIDGGEDPKFIARRILIFASEDIGNADPQALVVATAAAQAVERVGMPESQIILSQAAAYMACAPKSNAAVNAIFAAMDSVKRTRTTVPAHLQDAHYGGHEKLGHGIGYKYAHDYPNHYVKQQYLPDEIRGEKFYELSDMGYEKKLKEHMKFIKDHAD